MMSPKKSTTANLTAAPLDRRRALRGMLGIASLPALAAAGWLVSASNEARAQTKPLMEVWKDPNCGCCKDWVKLMEEAGFSVKTYATGNRAKRKQLGLPEKLGSCHTGRASQSRRASAARKSPSRTCAFTAECNAASRRRRHVRAACASPRALAVASPVSPRSASA